MPNTENRKNSNKKPTLQEHSQTVIIPQLTPEMLEQARRAAEQGKTAEQIEQEALAAAQAEQKAVESKQEAPTAEKPKTVQERPRERKLKFTFKEQREFETIDDDIAKLEEKLETLDAQIAANATNSVKLRELMEKKEETGNALDEKMERWVYLNDLNEKIQNADITKE